MLKKILSVFILGLIVLSPHMALAAAKKKVVVKKVPVATTYSEGWIERFSGGNSSGYFPSVVGWAYDGGKPVTVTATLVQTDGPLVFTSYGVTSGHRQDVNAYLGSKFKKAVDAAVVFEVDFPDAQQHPGHYRLSTMTFNGKPFGVFGGFDPEQAIGINSKLRIVSPQTGNTWLMGSYQTISWVDENPTHLTDEHYTIFLTRRDGTHSQGIIAEVQNQKSYSWHVGDVISGGPILENSGYTVEVVKQYVGGDNYSDRTGEFSIVPQAYFPCSGSSDPLCASPVQPVSSNNDPRRLADIRQLASALELYFNDNNSYPTGGLFQLAPNYITVVPSAPTPAGGSCSQSQNSYTYYSSGSSYQLSFCLGASTSGYSAGVHVLSPAGIQ